MSTVLTYIGPHSSILHCTAALAWIFRIDFAVEVAVSVDETRTLLYKDTLIMTELLYGEIKLFATQDQQQRAKYALGRLPEHEYDLFTILRLLTSIQEMYLLLARGTVFGTLETLGVEHKHRCRLTECHVVIGHRQYPRDACPRYMYVQY